MMMIDRSAGRRALVRMLRENREPSPLSVVTAPYLTLCRNKLLALVLIRLACAATIISGGEALKLASWTDTWEDRHDER